MRKGGQIFWRRNKSVQDCCYFSREKSLQKLNGRQLVVSGGIPCGASHLPPVLSAPSLLSLYFSFLYFPIFCPHAPALVTWKGASIGLVQPILREKELFDGGAERVNYRWMDRDWIIKQTWGRWDCFWAIRQHPMWFRDPGHCDGVCAHMWECEILTYICISMCAPTSTSNNCPGVVRPPCSAMWQTQDGLLAWRVHRALVRRIKNRIEELVETIIYSILYLQCDGEQWWALSKCNCENKLQNCGR